jgi:hypothetical protein
MVTLAEIAYKKVVIVTENTDVFIGSIDKMTAETEKNLEERELAAKATFSYYAFWDRCLVPGVSKEGNAKIDVLSDFSAYQERDDFPIRLSMHPLDYGLLVKWGNSKKSGTLSA